MLLYFCHMQKETVDGPSGYWINFTLNRTHMALTYKQIWCDRMEHTKDSITATASTLIPFEMNICKAHLIANIYHVHCVELNPLWLFIVFSRFHLCSIRQRFFPTYPFTSQSQCAIHDERKSGKVLHFISILSNKCADLFAHSFVTEQFSYSPFFSLLCFHCFALIP